MDIREAIRQRTAGRALDAQAAEAVARSIMAGKATAAQIAGLLTAIAAHGEAPAEIAGFVRAMRAAATPLPRSADGLVDTCGTGGDASGSFNISTAAALVAAAAGARVAKHGNRSFSSRCGSADVLEALGVRIDVPPAVTARCIESCGVGFLFAPLYHPSMKHAGPARREIGIRTIFNLAGPLTNPAGVRRQVMGVFAERLLRPIAEVLLELNVEHGLVVHGAGGLDEFSLAGPTRVCEVRGGRLSEREVTPGQLGLSAAPLEALRADDATASAATIRAVLAGEPGPACDVVIANAGAAVYVAGLADDLAGGVQLAAAAVRSGRAQAVLARLAELTGEGAT